MRRLALVTGASGFIGRRVLPRLIARGFEVHAVSRSAPGEPAGAHWHDADLGDYDAVDRLIRSVRPTHLLHLAWRATSGDYYHSPSNVLSLRDGLGLIDTFVRAGGERFVGAGSSAEYDLSLGRDLVEDRTPLMPNGLYGVCKKALFEVTARHAEQTGTQQAWGRVFFCYGPGEHPSRLVPTIVRELDRGAGVPFQSGTTVRDYVHVDDAAEAFAALVDSTAVGAFNIGSGVPIALNAFVRALATECGRPDGVLFDAVPTPAYEPPRVVADVTRIARELGWTAQMPLRDGLRETVAWWREPGRSGRS